MDEQVLEILSEIDDPELGVNLVDLGLVYAANRGLRRIAVQLTATSRSCPLGEYIREEARAFPGIALLDVELVWTPAWSPARMTSAGRAELGL
jgi:metal-sulfur cluster biosynthetic enzyme